MPNARLRQRFFTVLVLSVTPLVVSLTAKANELFDLAKVKASGQLKVAVYKDNAPFSDGAGDSLSGVDVALGRALASELGLKFTPLPFDAGENMNDDLRNMVWRGHYLGYGPADLMLHVPVDKYLIANNRQAMIFAPYYRETLVVLHDRKQVSDVRIGDDLKGKALTAERGSGAASALLGFSAGALREQVKIANNGIEAASAVIEGKAAAAYVTRAQAESALHLAKRSTTEFGVTPLLLPGMQENGWVIGIAVKTDNKELGRALETALKNLRERGDLAKIFNSQGLTLAAP